MAALRGLGRRVDEALNSVSRGRCYSRPRIKSSPPNGDAVPASQDICESSPASDYFECAPSHVVSDRHDTIPSPPPELESAPWHDERP
jgi:hypothetical protein